MTTTRDHGRNKIRMRRCGVRSSNRYHPLELAIRDMREANGRNPTTGARKGNHSCIGLSMAMIVLDTLSGSGKNDRRRWEDLLVNKHGLMREDATIIFKLRCSLLHGYYLPHPDKDIGDRTVLLTPYHDAYALDTSQTGLALVSVPVFCGRLIERVLAKASLDEWDTNLINTDYPQKNLNHLLRAP